MNKRESYYRFLIDQSDKNNAVTENLYGFYDKALLTISAGGIALSISFVKDFVGGDECIKHVILLKIVWGLLMGTIMAFLSRISWHRRRTRYTKTVSLMNKWP